MPRKIPPVNTNDLIKSYLAGESQNSIAKRIGVSRDAIRRIIVSNGVKVRGNADANRLMMTHRTPEENATNTTAATGIHYLIIAPLTLTLPASPTVRDTVRFTNLTELVNTVIDPNGALIRGVAGAMTLDSPTAAATLTYSGATKGWV